MIGTFVAVVGPSGVGKDSLISYARQRLEAEVAVVRRCITRHADDASEDHGSLTAEEFAEAVAKGEFALHWQAHGLRYGLPKSLEADLHAGKIVIANLSRAVLPDLRAKYEGAVVVEFTARPEIIAQRLLGRGRESEDEIRKRLSRTAKPIPDGAIRIDNSGEIETAGEEFLRVLRALLAARKAA